MIDTLLLIDGPSNINELLSKFSNNNKTKIICFEVEDHKILSELHIPHEIIENYIDYNDRRSYYNALERSQISGNDMVFLKWFMRRYFKTCQKFLKQS